MSCAHSVSAPPLAGNGASIAAARAQVREAVRADGLKLAVVDDDPTGTQTVRDVPLVTSWDHGELEWAIAKAEPVLAVLTNSRALAPDRATAINRTIGERLARLACRDGRPLRVISRGDSTLRGHFPAETEALAEGLAEGGLDVDLVLVCPAFPQAGRITANDVHLVRAAGGLTPVAQTEYARDPAFGYRSSNLCDWVRERAGAEVPVGSLSLEDVRAGGARVAERLLELRGTARYVIANAAEEGDLDLLALGVTCAEREGLRLIYRTGPSFIPARAGQAAPMPLDARELAAAGGRGLVVIGSYTALTTRQLEAAQMEHDLATVTLDVDALLAAPAADKAALLDRTAAALRTALGAGDAVLVTSRTAAHAAAGVASLSTSEAVSDALVRVVATVAAEAPLDWLLAKGGITSHEVAVCALGARRATVLGQLLPGQISVWELGAGCAQPGLRYVVFPGNVGGDGALAQALRRLKGPA